MECLTAMLLWAWEEMSLGSHVRMVIRRTFVSRLLIVRVCLTVRVVLCTAAGQLKACLDQTSRRNQSRHTTYECYHQVSADRAHLLSRDRTDCPSCSLTLALTASRAHLLSHWLPLARTYSRTGCPSHSLPVSIQYTHADHSIHTR